MSTLTGHAAWQIRQNERLIVTYQTQLDADTPDGATLTNVVGATEWFNGDTSAADRQSYTRTLTDGTVGTLDHEDAHTVAAALSGYLFEKSVENLTSGVSPTTTAAPGGSLVKRTSVLSAIFSSSSFLRISPTLASMCCTIDRKRC